MVTRREVALAGAMDRRDELLKNQFPVGDKRHGARHQGFGRDGPPRHVGGESRWPHTVGGGSHPPCKWLTSARVLYNQTYGFFTFGSSSAPPLLPVILTPHQNVPNECPS